MPAFLELSIHPESVRPTPQRRFCIRADASFRELQEVIVVLTGWEPRDSWWQFILPGREDEIEILALPERARHRSRLSDPALIPLSDHLDPDSLNASQCRYYHEVPDFRWRVNVLVHHAWEILDDRRRWLVLVEYPWPPLDLEGPDEYAPLLEAALSGHDPDGLLEAARLAFDWSPEVDADALAARLSEGDAADPRS